jgi:hypothetical protein
MTAMLIKEINLNKMENIEEKEIKVIGFYGRDNNLFLYNSFNDKFDNFLKVDLTESSFKYENATMDEALMCMHIEGNVGDLQELSLFI